MVSRVRVPLASFSTLASLPRRRLHGRMDTPPRDAPVHMPSLPPHLRVSPSSAHTFPMCAPLPPHDSPPHVLSPVPCAATLGHDPSRAHFFAFCVDCACSSASHAVVRNKEHYVKKPHIHHVTYRRQHKRASIVRVYRRAFPTRVCSKLPAGHRSDKVNTRNKRLLQTRVDNKRL